MAELDYNGLQRLADAATEGPWQWTGAPGDPGGSLESLSEEDNVLCAWRTSSEALIEVQHADAEFIAASRSAVPALLDRVRELEAERDALDAAFDRDLPWRYTEAVARAKTAEAERDAARSTIAKVREAVSGHPKCDRYEDDDAITCGWKNAYASVVWALGSVPSTGEGNE